MEILISELKQHPKNEEIYGKPENVEELSRLIEKSGFIKSLVINQDNVIISGHRRKAACESLEIDKVPFDRVETRDEWHLLQLLILENKYRAKTKYQIVNEAEYLFKIEEIEAEKRKAKFHGNQYLLKSGLRENFPQASNIGKAIDKVAEQLGHKSGRSLFDDRKVVDKIKELKADGKEKESSILLEALERSTFGAINLMKYDLSNMDEEVAEKLKSEKLKVSDLVKEKKEEVKKQKREELAEAGKDIKIDIDFRLGDFREVFKDIPDGSIDCIITDPPYPGEFLPLWSDLSKLAKRVLKPNGFCIAYSGQMFLPEVMERMSEHLDYYWTFSLIHSGRTQLVMPRKLFCGWKPLLVFQNGFKQTDLKIDDIIKGTGDEKKYHDWQQSEKELIPIIEGFTNIGDSILEPFAGGGTTIISSVKLKRHIIASEIDINTFNISKLRVHESLG